MTKIMCLIAYDSIPFQLFLLNLIYIIQIKTTTTLEKNYHIVLLRGINKVVKIWVGDKLLHRKGAFPQQLFGLKSV